MKKEANVHYVLIVDSDQQLVADMRSWLKNAGYEAGVAYNGKEALDKLLDHGSKPCGAVIMEILIPALNGIEVCQMINEHPLLPHLPVLLISQLPLRSDAFRRSMNRYNELSPVVDVLEKPFTKHQLLEKVDMIIRNHKKELE